jgi:HEAT repeat protein
MLWWQLFQLRLTNEKRRGRAAAALAKHKTPKAVEALVEAVKDNDLEVSKAALNSLIHMGRGSNAVWAVVESLEQRWDTKRKIWAAKALGEVGDKQAVVPLVKQLSHSDELLRQAVGASLVHFGEASVEPLLNGLKEEKTDSAVGDMQRQRRRVEATGEILAQVGERGVAALASMLRNEGPELRSYAAEALSACKSDRAAQALLEALKDTSERVRGEAASSLGKVGSPEVLDALAGMMRSDPFHRVRCAAAETLKKLGWCPQSPQDRIHFYVGLGKYKEAVQEGRIATDVLVESLKVKMDDWDAKYIVGALAELKDPRAVPILVEALAGKGLRKPASEALVQIGEPAVGAVGAMLRQKDAYLKRTAAEILGRLKAIQFAQELIELLRDVEYGIRDSADKALAQMGWEPSTENEQAVLAIKRYQWDEVIRMGPVGAQALHWFLEVDISAAQELVFFCNVAQTLAKLNDVDALKHILRFQGAGLGANVLGALETLLKRSSADVPTEDLLSLLSMPDVLIQSGGGDMSAEEVSSAHVKELAKEELLRRGDT